jgi:cell division protein FtsN
MRGIERRQSTRMTVRGSAYVNLGPDNGGIILNISEGGLCFQSAAPIQRTENIRFWFSYRSQRVEADQGQTWKDEDQARGVSRFVEARSTLAWTDDTQKRGGLRFTNLAPEAREQIRDWIQQPVQVYERSVLPLPSSLKPRYQSVKRLGRNVLRGVSATMEMVFRHIRTGKLRSGFSGGVVVGVFGSALLLSVFLLLSHRRVLGDSLIQLGERLGGSSPSQSISPEQQGNSRGPDPVSPESQPLSSEPKKAPPELETVTPALVEAPQPETLHPMPITAKPYRPKLEVTGSATPVQFVPSVKPSPTPSLGSKVGLASAPSIVVAPPADPNVKLSRATTAEMEPANPPRFHIEPSKVEDNRMRSEKYLELGKFKEKLLADKTTGQLSQLGFPATIVPWSRFFGKSYQVLVGPYETDREAQAAQKDLASLGFAPRSYERGKRDFYLPPALRVGGTRLPVGDCVVIWESYTPNAIVKFEDARGMTVLAIEGKWMKRSPRYTQDAIVYISNKDGSRTLVEIRFSGMEQALVLGKGEPSSGP